MIGYRDDELFGEGFTDPIQVSRHETVAMGNVDIPAYLLEHADLDEVQRDFLQDIVDEQIDDIDIDYFREIMEQYLDGRDYCVWLCKTPEDVYNSYVDPFSEETISCEEYCRTCVNPHQIPEDAIILADLGQQGALYAWKTGRKEKTDDIVRNRVFPK